ncbi:hypothetical protein [Rhizobium gallicum]|uniref:hypothetical protein n=1 Tax=Rhizobium gallicum TaxID=56730 RepID=UPI001EF89A12|nr:hypothetical protein [Rhizobium gallicum]ULJ73016.1 hypothetical protein L2W42_05060 [Rhizobium gallicum]
MYAGAKIQITPLMANRLIALIGTRLALPVSPLPGEGLADVIFRAAAINGLKTTNRFMPGLKRPLSHNSVAMYSFDFPALADFLGTPTGADDIAHLDYTRTTLSRRAGNGPFNFFGTYLPCKQLINHRRIAPRSLIKSNHSKAIWQISALQFDPLSHELLLERCPVCTDLLDFWHPAGVSRCSACGPSLDLRDFPQESVQCGDPEALRFVTAFIDPEVEKSVDKVHDDLRRLDAGQLFMLCVFVAAVLDDELRNGARRCFTGVSVSPLSLSVAGRAVMNWPNGLACLHERLVGTEIFRGRSFDRHPLEALLRQTKIFQPATIGAARTAMHLPRVETFTEAQVVQSGATSASSHLRLHKFTKRSEAVSRMSKAVGIPRGVLFECFLSRLIPCPDAKLAEAVGGDHGPFSTFARGLRPRQSRNKVSLSVRGTVSALYNGLGNPWPLILKGLQQGLLPVTKVEADDWLRTLRVEEFQPWIEYCHDLQPSTDFVNLPIDYEEVGFYLDLEMGTVRSNLGPYCREAEIKTLERLHNFRTMYLPVREIYNRLVIGGTPRSEWLISKQLNQAGVRCSEKATSYRLRADVNQILDTL